MDFIKSLFCGCNIEDPIYTHVINRSEMLLTISLYNLDYEIFDKKTGEPVDCAVCDYSEYDHDIKIYKYARFMNQ